MISQLQGFVTQEQINTIIDIIINQYRLYKRHISSPQFQSLFRAEYNPHKKQHSVSWAISSAFPSNTIIAENLQIERLHYGRGHTRPELSSDHIIIHILNSTTHFNASYLKKYYAMNAEGSDPHKRYCYFKFQVDHSNLIGISLCFPDPCGKIVAEEILIAEKEMIRLIA